MSFSQVDIFNMAMVHIGEPTILAFSDNNRRGRLATTIYQPMFLSVLADIDWTFARRFKRLQETTETDNLETVNETYGLYTYDLPSDCLVPRDLYPRGSRERWEVVGRFLQCFKSYDDGVYLYYTTTEVTAALASHAFCMALAARLAQAAALPLTQDPTVMQAMANLYSIYREEAYHSDTNIGNSYREPDNEDDYDSFVNVENL
jgi:hypothetical protein